MSWWNTFYNVGTGGGGTTVILKKETEMEVTAQQSNVNMEVSDKTGVEFTTENKIKEVKFKVTWQNNLQP